MAVDRFLVNGLGGTAGFGENTLAAGNDNSSPAIDITGIFAGGLDFLGTTYTQVFVNTNGNITFGSPFNRPTGSIPAFGEYVFGPTGFVPQEITMIAVFWTDVDTTGAADGVPTPGGNSTGSNRVYWDLDTANHVFTVTWDDVGYSPAQTEPANAFQLQLTDRGGGDFDVVFRYESIDHGGDFFNKGIQADFNRYIGDFAFPLTLDTDPGNTGIEGVYEYTVRSGGAGNDILTGTGHEDLIDGGAGSDELNGAAGNDRLWGGAGNDQLSGGDGDDQLDGGAGADTMAGGAGVNFYAVDDPGDTVLEVSGIDGYDIVVASIDYSLAGLPFVESLGLHFDSLAQFGEGNDLGNSISGNGADNVLFGGGGFDFVYGYGGDDQIFGGVDNDTLSGSEGDDTLDGGTGDDQLYGDAGSDTASYAGTDSAVTVSLAVSDPQDTFGAGTDTLSGIENLTGSLHDDVLTGDAFDNVLEGGPGNDTLAGGAGNDTASYASAFDAVVVSLLALGPQDTLGAGIDSLTGFENLSGGWGDDLLTGNALANTLDGGAGIDILVGGAGADTLIYDAADLAVAGGSGSDTIELNERSQSLNFTIAAGRPVLAGIDVIELGPGYTGRLKLDTTSLAIADGFAGSRTLRVDGEGIVTLAGGNWVDGGDVTVGSDIYRQYTPAGGTGDKLQLNANLAVLTRDVPEPQSVRLGTDGFDVLGGTLDGDTMLGLDGGDQLLGRGGADVLFGGAGDDYSLQGGPGDDIVVGGAGNDSLSGGTGNDALFGGAGSDSLGDHQGNNALYGGAGDDIFTVSTGTNVVTGGTGRDTYSMDFFALLFTPHLAGDFRVTDFELGGLDELSNPTGDLIDTGILLDFTPGFTGGNPFNASVGIFRLQQEGLDTLFQWDRDAAAGVNYSWRTLIRLEDTNASDLTTANFTGNLQPDGSTEPGVHLIGDDSDNQLTGTHSDDVLTGLGGADNLFGKAGNDEIDGGDGNDSLGGGPGNDLLIGGEGNDNLQNFFSISPGIDTLLGNGGDDSFFGSAGVMDGGDGADRFTLFFSTASLAATGGEGQDSYSLLTPAADIEIDARITDFEAGPGGDTFEIFFSGNGYTGGNPYSAGLGFLRVVQDDADTLVQWDRDGAAGTDFEWATLVTLEGVNATALTQANVTGPYPLDGSDVPGVTRDGTGDPDSFTGTIADDTLNGLAGNDSLFGGAGDDVVTGGAGDDVLFGDLGDDVVSGGDGNDSFEGSPLFLTAIGGERGAAGNDVLNGGAGDDRFFDTNGVNILNGGDGADTFSFSSGGSFIFSLDPSQPIPEPDPVLSRNTVTGGAGRDTYNADSQDLIDFRITDFTAGPGGDFLNVAPLLDLSDGYSSGSPFDPAARFFRLVQSGPDTRFQWDRDGPGTAHAFETVFTLQGVAAASITSDNFTGDDLIIGTADADDLFGTIGNDHLQGLGGDDSLDGLLGADLMEGGTGSDLYFVDNAGDEVVETSNDPDPSAPAGLSPSALSISAAGVLEGVIDTVVAAVNYSLENREFVEHLTLGVAASAALNATGNALANRLTGNEFQNSLFGRGGDDILNGGGGADTAVYAGSKALYTVTRLDAAVTVSSDAEGTDTLTSIEKLQFANGVMLLGGSGTDAWNSAAGNETFDGGAGDDTVSYANATASVAASLAVSGDQNTGGAGTDAFAGIENLTGSAFNDLLTGDESANVLRGLAGRDSLFGQAGNDTLEGGAGNDTLDGGGNADTASYATATAGVTVSLALTDTQNTGGAGIDALFSIENLTGSAHHDTLTGNGAANILNGRGGSDTLIGGAGNDTYEVNSASDRVTEASGGGTDLVQSTATSYSLPGNVENLTLLASGNIAGAGNTLPNTLTGNGGNNTLNGGAGNDKLNGGAGNDVLHGLAGADVLTGGAGADVFDFDAPGDSGTGNATRDRIADFSAAEGDRIDLSTIDANGSGSGNGKFQFITGVFSGNSTGKLRFDAGSHLLLGSTDADTDAEFSILLPDLNGMVAGDFIL